MFIAMNRFKVIKGREEDFERVWRSRESRLEELAGFVEFNLLRGPEREDHTLYSSHTIWASKEQFTAWTKSEQFRASHSNAGGGGKSAFIGHPEFEGFEAVLTQKNSRLQNVAE